MKKCQLYRACEPTTWLLQEELPWPHITAPWRMEWGWGKGNKRTADSSDFVSTADTQSKAHRSEPSGCWSPRHGHRRCDLDMKSSHHPSQLRPISMHMRGDSCMTLHNVARLGWKWTIGGMQPQDYEVKSQRGSVRRAWWGSRFLEGVAFHWVMLAGENLKTSLNDQGLHYALQCQRSCDVSCFHSRAPWNRCGDWEEALRINNSTSFCSGNLSAQELQKQSDDLFSCPIPKQVPAEVTSHSWMAVPPACVGLSKGHVVVMHGESRNVDFCKD